ncbi:MAG: NTP transferase domain-containing protein [Planctomycetaceae bacterium]|nr:NTP transferase domain-containing protein [Planctomycetaceae bacterium]
MAKVIGVITARMGSTRLPGKVMIPLGSKSTFAHHVERMQHVRGLDGVFVGTSDEPENQPLIEEAKKLGCGWYAGARQDIVDRHVQLCQREKADAVLRVTCDSPIFDIDSASDFVQLFKREPHDYIAASNMTMIQGTLSELISYKALLKLHEHYRGAALAIPIKENPDRYDIHRIPIDQEICRPEYRLTIDEELDIEMIDTIHKALYRDGVPLKLRDVYTWLDDNPQVARINMQVGIKGCEQASANVMDRVLFAIVPSGNRQVILDEQKRPIDPDTFLTQLRDLFPILKGRIQA